MQPKSKMTFRFDGTAPQAVPGTKNAKPDIESIAPVPEATARKPEAPSATGQVRPIQTRTPRIFAPIGPKRDAGQTNETAPTPEELQIMNNRKPSDKPMLEAWHSPYQDDIHALEEIIRRTGPADLPPHQENKHQRASSIPPQKESVPGPSPLHAMRSDKAPSRTQPGLNGTMGAEASIPLTPKKNTELRQATSAEAHSEDRYEGTPSLRGFSGQKQQVKQASWQLDTDGSLSSDHFIPEEMIADPSRTGNKWAGSSSYRYRSRDEGPSWMRIFVSVLGAIITGGIFGYLVLSLFTGEPLFPGKGSNAVPAITQPSSTADSGKAGPSATKKPAASAPLDTGTNAQEGSNGMPASSALPASTVYLLQYGVFQNAESMKDAMGKLAKLGLAAASDTSNGYRVYAGVASTKEEAQSLSKWMAGTEVYMKPFEQEATTLQGLAGADKWSVLLKQGEAVSRSLTKLTVAGVRQDKLASLDAAGKKELQSAYSAWQKASSGMDQWTGDNAAAAKQIASNLDTAVKLLSDYEANPTRAALRDAQSSTMKAVLADIKLRQALQHAASGS